MPIDDRNDIPVVLRFLATTGCRLLGLADSREAIDAQCRRLDLVAQWQDDTLGVTYASGQPRVINSITGPVTGVVIQGGDIGEVRF